MRLPEYMHHHNYVCWSGLRFKCRSESIEYKLVYNTYNPHIFIQLNRCLDDDCHVHSPIHISTQRLWYRLSYLHISSRAISMAPPQVPWRWANTVSNRTIEKYATLLKQTSKDLGPVRSWSTFTQGIAVVEQWTTEHNKYSIPMYTNIELYTHVRGRAKMYGQLSISYSDIKSLTLRLWHWVSNIESLTLSLWHWVTDIEALILSYWHWVSDI